MEVDSASADERPASVPSQEVVEESAVEESAAPTQLDKDLKMDTPAVVEPAAPMESDQRQDTSSEQAEFEFDDENEIALDEDSDDEDSEEDVNAADLRLDDMEDVLPVSDAPPRTANEIVDLPAPEPPEKIVISAHCELLQVGNVSARIDEQLVVKGLENGKAVIEGTILCLGDRTPLGRVWEIFGPVRHPHYVVRTTVDMPPGEIVFAPQPEASFVDANYVSSSRGCDASNVHDEELAEHLQEFSDDEAQTDAKRTATKRPWESGEDHRQGEVSPGGLSAPSLPPSQVLGSCT